MNHDWQYIDFRMGDPAWREAYENAIDEHRNIGLARAIADRTVPFQGPFEAVRAATDAMTPEGLAASIPSIVEAVAEAVAVKLDRQIGQQRVHTPTTGRNVPKPDQRRHAPIGQAAKCETVAELHLRRARESQAAMESIGRMPAPKNSGTSISPALAFASARAQAAALEKERISAGWKRAMADASKRQLGIGP